MLKRFCRAVALSLALAMLAPGTSLAGGPVHVKGYHRKDGTYVAPHYRSAPDENFSNNWSTKGNVNPYTGKPGTLVSPPSTGKWGQSPRFEEQYR
jgi:hypothetical protein